MDALILVSTLGFAVYVAIALAAGAVIGAQKGNTIEAVLWCLFLGPFGAIVACLLVDGRYLCPMCRSRVNSGALICAACRTALRWGDRGPGVAG